MAVDGVMSVTVDFGEKLVYVWGFAENDSIVAALNGIGYIVNIKADKSTGIVDKNILSSQKFIQKKKQIDPGLTTTAKGDYYLEGKLGGMSCANCVRAVENGLRSLTGVATVRIALLSERVEITYDSTSVTVDAINVKIGALGYSLQVLKSSPIGDAMRRTLVFLITGMSCASCAVKIEKMLQGLTGVASATVSCMTNKGEVALQDTDVSVGPRDIIEAVRKLGYGCDLDNKDSTADDENAGSIELHSWTRLLVMALIFGVPIIVVHTSMAVSPMVMMTLDVSCACHGAVTRGQLLMLSLALPMQFGVGYKFYRSAFLSALHYSFGMDCLVVTGTTITFVYSIVSLMLSCSTGIPTKVRLCTKR